MHMLEEKVVLSMEIVLIGLKKQVNIFYSFKYAYIQKF